MPTMLVTGGNRGLGLEFVRQYRDEGWNVIAACREPAQAQAARDSGALIEKLDVCDFEAIRALTAKLAGTSVDLLINNAGYHPGFQPLGQLRYENWQTAFHINVIAPLQVAEAFTPLIPAGGKIVNIGSRQGSITCNVEGGRYLYRATKAALHCITRSLAVDLAPRDVAVAALHPGWAKTDMGGATADIEVAESIAGMKKVIAGLGSHNSGCLIDYSGKEIPW